MRPAASGVIASLLSLAGAVPALAQGVDPAAQPPPAAKQKEVEGTGLAAKEQPAVVDDGPSYIVSRFLLEYAGPTPGTDLPDLQAPGFQNITVHLGKKPEGYVRARPGVEAVTIRLSDVTEGSGGKFFQSAIEEVCSAVVAELNRRGIFAAFVGPDPRDIDERPPFKDNRVGRTSLLLSVHTAVVKDVRTVAAGDRELPGEPINNPAHARIRERSPVQPGEALRKDELDDYLYRLNRHPGRRVDASVSAASSEEPGAAQLDYLVGEIKPWTAYFQVSNTGTEETNTWRERFGFVHNQLTNHDDILRLEYATAGFDASNAVLPSYEFPIYSDVVRGRVYGSWTEFTASDVGRHNDQFSGNSWSAGGELIGNIIQHGPLFVDLYAGMSFEHYRVVNQISNVEGKVDYLVPAVGTRIERYTDAATTYGDIGVIWDLPGVTNVDQKDVDNMGRPPPVDKEWVILRWELGQSLYLEPLLVSNTDVKDMTLAHELAGVFRGQYAFGHRLIPNLQSVAGGLYSVRGYPESVTAGDDLYLGSFEYRFHLPNAMGQHDPGKFFGRDFRWAPQAPYGRADWDLILKGFVDAARITNSDIQPTESDATLVGAGVGAELQVYRNLNLRLDWGFPLKALHTQDRDVTTGSSQVYFAATLSY